MLVEQDSYGPVVVFPLPNGRRPYLRVCGGPPGRPYERPFFELSDSCGMHAEDVEALAHGLLDMMREFRHPEGIQDEPQRGVR